MDRFWELVGEYSKNPSLRKGQNYFNALYETYPEIANRIRGTSVDPFYSDDRIESFLLIVEAGVRESL